MHLHVRKFPTQAPPPPKIQVQLPPVDAAGVNVERSRLVYVAIKIMGEYKMKTFINLEDYLLVLWRRGGTGSGESKSGSEVSSWETPLTAGMILVAA